MERIIKEAQSVLAYFFRITTSVVFASAVYITVFWGVDCELGVRLLWQILGSSAVCALGCCLVSGSQVSGKEISKRGMQIRMVLLYIYINVIVLSCGFIFEWFYLSDWKMILGMELCIAFTFCVVTVLSYFADYKAAEKMNQRLQERKQQEIDKI